MYLNIFFFFVTLISTILLRNHELWLALVVFGIALSLFYINNFDNFTICMILLFSLILSVCTYIVVKYKICAFNVSKNAIPFWLPFCWMIVMIFAFFLTHKDVRQLLT